MAVTASAGGPVGYLLDSMVSLDRFRGAQQERFEALTEREREVLTLVAKGLPNPVIAKQLNISRSTVQNHRAYVRQKLDIATEADYFKYALAYDLIKL